MLIGVRFLLLFAVVAIAITSLGYLFTKNPRFLALTKNIIRITLVLAGLLALMYVVERLLLA